MDERFLTPGNFLMIGKTFRKDKVFKIVYKNSVDGTLYSLCNILTDGWCTGFVGRNQFEEMLREYTSQGLTLLTLEEITAYVLMENPLSNKDEVIEKHLIKGINRYADLRAMLDEYLLLNIKKINNLNSNVNLSFDDF